VTVRIVGQAAREPGYRVISLAGCCASVYIRAYIYIYIRIFCCTQYTAIYVGTYTSSYPDRMSRISISTHIMNRFSKSIPSLPPSHLYSHTILQQYFPNVHNIHNIMCDRVVRCICKTYLNSI